MQLPFEDNRFDILVSVRFLSEIVTFADAKKALKEFSRVSRCWAILQLSETNEGNGRLPEEGAAMRDLMEPSQVDDLLANHGFKPLKRFLVREDGDGISRINHILCEVL
jgi:ubiquinone/menaquinone biosynthesis C-methylase UbiE